MMAALHLFKVLFGWRFLLPLTLHSCLLLFIGQFSKPLYFGRKYSHIPGTHGSFPIIFHIFPRYAFLSTTCLHCTFCQLLFSLCLQVFVETPQTQVGRVCFIAFIKHNRRQLPVAQGFFRCTECHIETTALAEHLPRPVRRSSFLFLIFRTLCFSHSVLCFFGFHANHFSFGT